MRWNESIRGRERGLGYGNTTVPHFSHGIYPKTPGGYLKPGIATNYGYSNNSTVHPITAWLTST
jgi:hypothetical protein